MCTYKKLCALPKYGECFSNCSMIPGYMQDCSSIVPYIVVSEVQKGVCTCARAAAPRMLEVLQKLLYDSCLHTMFQPNRTSSFGDTKNADVLVLPHVLLPHVRTCGKTQKSWGRVTICCMMPGHIPNLSKIGPVVSEMRKMGVHVRTCRGTPNLKKASATAV